MSTLVEKIKRSQARAEAKNRETIKPYVIVEGLGIQGMDISLNLQQLQELSRLYHVLESKLERTKEEEQLGAFLSIFKGYSVAEEELWSNFSE